MSIVKAALEKWAQNDKSWSSDRLQTVGASEVGRCARAIYYAKNEGDECFGASRDEDYTETWGFKVRGNVFENGCWVPAMRELYGDRLLFAGDQQRTFRSGFLTATPDGYLVDLDQDEKQRLGLPLDYQGGLDLDAKSLDPRVNLAEPKAEHRYQLIVQMGLLNESGFPCQYAMISYTNTSDFSDIKEYLVEFDPAIYEQAKIRSQKIMTAESAAELDPEGIVAGGKECAYCPFTKACAELRCSRIPERTWQEKPLPPTQATLLEAHIKSYHDAVDAGEVWEGAAAQEKEAIRVILEGAGVRTYKGDGVSVSWSKVAGRKSWDNAAIREALQHVTSASDDLMKETYQKEGEPSDRLTITVKK